MSGTERRRRVDKQKERLAEVEKVRGYERGLELDEIVGATDYTGKLMFLVRWQNCNELDLLPAKEVNEHSPYEVIKYYEGKCPLNRLTQERSESNVPIIQRSPPSPPPPVISKVEAADEQMETATE